MNSDEKLVRIKKIVGQETKAFLVKARESAALTQTQATQLLGYESVSRLQEFESGNASIPMPEMQRIVLAYGLPPMQLQDFMMRVHQLIAESNKRRT